MSIATRRNIPTTPRVLRGYPRTWVKLAQGRKGDLVAFAGHAQKTLVVFPPRHLPPAAQEGDWVQISATPAKSGACFVGKALGTAGYGWHLVKAADAPKRGHFAGVDDAVAALMLRRLESRKAPKAIEPAAVEQTPVEAFVQELKSYDMDGDKNHVNALHKAWLALTDDDQMAILEDGALDTRMQAVFGA